jgi:glucosamine--fructose-6-phosphate aminotransferase (isomerizing)
MCGIVGYIGHRNAYPIIINGLKRLEYRGYDSAGLALYNEPRLIVKKTKGKVAELEKLFTNPEEKQGNVGLGHTRWATHGEPNDINAHPHVSNSGNLVIVHNGIIENYEPIKQTLIKRGYHFKSDTDTEVLINLIEDIMTNEKVGLGKAVQMALNEVVGAYAIVVFDKRTPDEIVLARLGSPLAIGVGDGEYFIASDATPFIEFTKNAMYLEDEQMAIVQRGKEIEIRNIKDDSKVVPYIQELQLSLEQIEKGGYEHFMLKEIYEQPDILRDTMRGRVLPEQNLIKLSGIDNYLNKFLNADRIVMIGAGTSWHAGLVGEYLFEELARIPVEVEYSSEFRYRNPIIKETDIVMPISQSGETADTLAAIKLAKEKNAFIYAICNVVGSSIPRESDSGTYTHAGPEIGVASTKAFTSQVLVMAMMALKLAKEKGTISLSEYNLYLSELAQIPEKIEKTLQTDLYIQQIAHHYKDATNALYLGRGFNFPVALEGALKLKEISYIHAEGYPAAEMKHGPIALIDENMPVFVIATKKSQYEKIVSNIQEIKSRKGKIIAIVTEGDTQVKNLADHVIEIPETVGPFTPLLATIPLQLLSYYIAVYRGCNVDQPRNLAKSVTVE